MSHWAVQYIGIPWSRGGSGPDSYDCWGFLRMVMDRHYGIQMPEIDDRRFDARRAANQISTNQERQNWYSVDAPADGDVVLMCRARIPVHIGLWVQTGNSAGVLHCAERMGVLFSSLNAAKQMGWNQCEYLRRK